MLYNICYITYPELLYNIQVWLYNIQDGYITHPNLPDDSLPYSSCTIWPCLGTVQVQVLQILQYYNVMYYINDCKQLEYWPHHIVI